MTRIFFVKDNKDNFGQLFLIQKLLCVVQVVFFKVSHTHFVIVFFLHFCWDITNFIVSLQR